MAHQKGKDGIKMPPQLPRASSTASQANTAAHTIGIYRDGAAVQITLTTANEYTSIELYDSLIQSVENGYLRLELKLPRS